MRNHSDTNQLAHGVGGSGLYSDGKFSFYPSATTLWRLPDRKALSEGYDWVCNHLSEFGMVTPVFPLECQDSGISKQSNKDGEITSKKYPSFYLSLKQREQLTQKLEQACGASAVQRVAAAEPRKRGDGQRGGQVVGQREGLDRLIADHDRSEVQRAGHDDGRNARALQGDRLRRPRRVVADRQRARRHRPQANSMR